METPIVGLGTVASAGYRRRVFRGAGRRCGPEPDLAPGFIRRYSLVFLMLPQISLAEMTSAAYAAGCG